MIEYVVVHELVHLIEPHQTTAFWDRVERVVSDGCDRKQWLAQNGVSYNLWRSVRRGGDHIHQRLWQNLRSFER